MNKMREEFNEWFDSNHKTENESLNFAISEAMFDAWKASRSALCVELPNEEVPGRFDGDGETGYVNGYNSSLSDVKEHLRFHGVTYK